MPHPNQANQQRPSRHVWLDKAGISVTLAISLLGLVIAGFGGIAATLVSWGRTDQRVIGLEAGQSRIEAKIDTLVTRSELDAVHKRLERVEARQRE